MSARQRVEKRSEVNRHLSGRLSVHHNAHASNTASKQPKTALEVGADVFANVSSLADANPQPPCRKSKLSDAEFFKDQAELYGGKQGSASSSMSLDRISKMTTDAANRSRKFWMVSSVFDFFNNFRRSLRQTMDVNREVKSNVRALKLVTKSGKDPGFIKSKLKTCCKRKGIYELAKLLHVDSAGDCHLFSWRSI